MNTTPRLASRFALLAALGLGSAAALVAPAAAQRDIDPPAESARPAAPASPEDSARRSDDGRLALASLEPQRGRSSSRATSRPTTRSTPSRSVQRSSPSRSVQRSTPSRSVQRSRPSSTPSRGVQRGSSSRPSVRPSSPPSRPSVTPSRPSVAPSRPSVAPSRPGVVPDRSRVAPSRSGVPEYGSDRGVRYLSPERSRSIPVRPDAGRDRSSSIAPTIDLGGPASRTTPGHPPVRETTSLPSERPLLLDLGDGTRPRRTPVPRLSGSTSGLRTDATRSRVTPSHRHDASTERLLGEGRVSLRTRAVTRSSILDRYRGPEPEASAPSGRAVRPDTATRREAADAARTRPTARELNARTGPSALRGATGGSALDLPRSTDRERASAREPTAADRERRAGERELTGPGARTATPSRRDSAVRPEAVARRDPAAGLGGAAARSERVAPAERARLQERTLSRFADLAQREPEVARTRLRTGEAVRVATELGMRTGMETATRALGFSARTLDRADRRRLDPAERARTGRDARSADDVRRGSADYDGGTTPTHGGDDDWDGDGDWDHDDDHHGHHDHHDKWRFSFLWYGGNTYFVGGYFGWLWNVNLCWKSWWFSYGWSPYTCNVYGYWPYWNHAYYPVHSYYSYPPVVYSTVIYDTVDYGYGGGYGDGGSQVVYVDAPQAYADPAPVSDVPAGEAVVGVPAAAAPAGADPEALSRAASHYLTQGDRAFRDSRYGDAVHFYAKAVEFAPDEGVLYLILSDALFATGDYHYAAYALRKALELDPTLVESIVDKHAFYTDPTEFDRQIAVLETYLQDHFIDDDARLLLAANYLFGNRPAAAVDLLESPFSHTVKETAAARLILESARAVQHGQPR